MHDSPHPWRDAMTATTQARRPKLALGTILVLDVAVIAVAWLIGSVALQLISHLPAF
jgi:hypothetical protein